MALLQVAVEIEPILEYALGYVTDRPEQSAAAIAALVGVLFNYQKTGHLPIGRFPWRYAREMVRDLGDKYFGVTRPRGVPAVVVDGPPEAVMETLRDHHFESTDLYSYEYEDEAWGLRRPSGVWPHPVTAEDTPMELHPRGFKTRDGKTLVNAHHEASRFERLGAHLAEAVLSWERGRDRLAAVLDDARLSYTEIDSEAAAGIEVVAPPSKGPRS